MQLSIELIKQLTAFNEQDEQALIDKEKSKVVNIKLISGALFQVLEQIQDLTTKGYELLPHSPHNQISPTGSGFLQIALKVPDALLVNPLKDAEKAGKQAYFQHLEERKQSLLEEYLAQEEEAEIAAQLAIQEQARKDRRKDILELIK